MKSKMFRNLRLLLRAMGFRVHTKDILLLENWRDESFKNKNFSDGIIHTSKEVVSLKKPAPVKCMRAFSERPGIKIADET
ncbi:MAG: hypothetical protein ABW036_02855 [Flavitalea sp.]